MQAALNGMLAHKVFSSSIDLQRIAVGGHSLGGFSALGLCGTLPDYTNPQIKAALIYSSAASGYLYTEEELSNVRMPTMYFIGEKERESTRGDANIQEISQKIFQSFHAPKYYLEVKGASHFSFANQLMEGIGARFLSGTESEFDVIRPYSIAFLEKYAANKTGQDTLLRNKAAGFTRFEVQE